MKIVTVIPLAKGVFKEDLTYFTSKDIPDRSIVSIPMRNKKILGLVVSIEDVASAKSDIKDMSFNLKKINEIKEHSVFSDKFLEAGIELSQYFATQKGTTLVSIIPSAFREEYDQIAKFSSLSKSVLVEENISKNLKAEKLLFQTSLPNRITMYKNIIRGSFADKKSVFMVLPTERDIEIFTESLSKGIENFTFSIHGGLSTKKQIEKFGQIISSSHPVLVLGTVPYLSIPRQDFGTIIIEHESAGSYKMFNKPHFDMRILVELFASKIKAKLIFGDSLLRFETIARGEMDYLTEMHPLSFKVNFDGEIKIAGPAHDATQSVVSKKEFKVLKEDTIKEIQAAVLNMESIFLFALRKGLATETICRDCNEPVMCENCSVPVVLYLSRDRKKRMFICNRCGTKKNPEMKCSKCESWNLMPLGIGTDTVFEEIKKNFPETKIFKLDKESAKTAKQAQKIAKEFEETPGSILVGSELALFYLQEKVPLSIIASFDSLWSVPSFKINEKIIQLILGIISKTSKKLIIQTKNEKDPAIIAVMTENLLSFIREELGDRKNLGYPPFKRFIKISHLGDKQEMTTIKQNLSEIFKEYNPEIFSGFVSKLKNKYVTNALIKLDHKKWSLPELSASSSIDQNLLAKFLSLPPTFSVNVDPEDLL